MMKKMVGFKAICILTLFLAIFSVVSVSASTYTSNANLFENTYSNNLIDMANTQIENFIDKKFVLVQYDQNYYLVVSDKYSVNGNTITFTDSHVLSAVRYTSGYNTYYEYSSFTEVSTVVYANNISISNLAFPRAISSSKFDSYKSNANLIRLLMFILGLVFAIFLLRKGAFYEYR